MLVSDVLTYARQIAQTDTNGISDTLGLAFCNDALQNSTRSMLSKNIDASQTQESYTNLTTQSPNTYAWPSDMFSLKTIEVNFTDSTQNNYLQAVSFDVANIQQSSFDWLRINQPTSAPIFDNRGDTFEIFPTPTQAIPNGIKIFYFLTPTEYSSTSSTINYPQSLDYRMLACRVASLYATQQLDYSMAQAFETEYQKRLHDIINILEPGTQQPIKVQPLLISGWQF